MVVEVQPHLEVLVMSLRVQADSPPQAPRTLHLKGQEVHQLTCMSVGGGAYLCERQRFFLGGVVVSMTSQIKRVFLKTRRRPFDLRLLQEHIPSIHNITARGKYITTLIKTSMEKMFGIFTSGTTVLRSFAM